MKNKTDYLNFLRIICCFFVIINHTNSYIFMQGSPSINWYLSLCFFYMCKVAVPIFFMISGVCLLNKEESLKDLFLKRIFKILVVILSFSFIYYLYDVYKNGTDFNLLRFIKIIYEKNITNSFWYLYTYLAYLCVLPILRSVVKNLKNSEFIFIFLLWIIFNGILSWVPHYINKIPMVNSYFNLSILTNYFMYSLCGYFLQYRVKIKNNKKYSLIYLIVFILCIFINVMLTRYDYLQGLSHFWYMDNISSIFIVLESICLFLLAKSMFNINQKIINIISSTTFGIYLLGDLFIDIYHSIFLKLFITLNPIIGVFIYQLMIYFTSFIIIYILRKNSILKKIL